MGLVLRPTLAVPAASTTSTAPLVPVTSTTSLAGASLVNGNCTACVERLDNITDPDACSLETLDTDLLKAHERPQPDPFDHNYVSTNFA